MPDKELKIFQFQFILNYMSKPSTAEKVLYLHQHFFANGNYQDAVCKDLLPVIESGIKKRKVVTAQQQQAGDAVQANMALMDSMKLETRQETRQSAFMVKQLDKIKKMISGQYAFEK